LKEYHQLDEIQEDLFQNKLSCVELVEYYLQKIVSLKHLNAFVEVYDQEALKKAQEVDQKIRRNKAGALAGLVFGAKDLLCYQNHGVSGASEILKGYESPFSSTAIQKLLDADAILIGRQNCDEFGMGSSNENSSFGPALNAFDTSRVPGGSSGGSAVAVQADMCLASLGTDTGGSVRQPAAFCGTVGMKPTYSRVSRWGLLSYASSFDTIGVLAKSVQDAELILNTISGPDEKDATSSQEPLRSSKDVNCQDWSVGMLAESLEGDGLQKEILSSMKRVKDCLIEASVPVDLVHKDIFKYALPTYYILTTAEASTNLSRYDGVHYGQRSDQSEDLEQLYKNSRTEGFGDEVRRRIMLGTFVLSAEYHDAYFKKAQEVRQLIREELKQVLNEHDVLILPTSPTTAFKIGQHSEDPLQMYKSDLFTVLASVAGLPAISIPMGSDKNGLPIGIQIMADSFREDKIFAFSSYLINQLNSHN
jgi:aspartyl-tRNA(Asn)/glutamyl-tRNA(Gln) amidotransferase subunit A